MDGLTMNNGEVSSFEPSEAGLRGVGMPDHETRLRQPGPRWLNWDSQFKK